MSDSSTVGKPDVDLAAMAVAQFPESQGPDRPGERLPAPVEARPLPAGSHDDGFGHYRDQYDRAFELMKSLADQEYERADKVSQGARQAFAFVAGFFGVVQLAASGSNGGLSSAQRHVTLVVALVAAVSVLVTAILAIKADGLKAFNNLSSDDVLDSTNQSVEIERPASEDFLRLYSTELDERRRAVVERRAWLTKAQIAAVVSVVILSGELILTLAGRL
jgi:hypothetical protein